MKRTLIIIFILMALCAFFFSIWISADAEWSGVDTTVVEKFAKEAGRPPSEPLLNTERGDILLFLFLIAGTAGGFVGGFYFRELFPPRPEASARQPDV
jgi:ABC-type cobalt transport system substrate-binding protein